MEKWIYFYFSGVFIILDFGIILFQFDNSLLLADETAISNLEFILFRHPPPPTPTPPPTPKTTLLLNP